MEELEFLFFERDLWKIFVEYFSRMHERVYNGKLEG